MTDISKEDMRERLGNIDQIRDLLFGHKIKEYQQRFEKWDQRLEKVESEFSSFQSEMRDRLTQLQDSLLTEIRSSLDSFDKTLKYLSLTTHEETSKLQQELNLIDQKKSNAIESLAKNVSNQGNFLKHEISEVRDKMEEDIEDLRNQFLKKIEKEFSNLKDNKVSRTDLAEVLFEICLKIKGTEFVPNLKDAVDNQVKTEFLLPEQPNQEQHN